MCVCVIKFIVRNGKRKWQKGKRWSHNWIGVFLLGQLPTGLSRTATDPLILSHLRETLLAAACHSGILKEDRALNTVLSHCFEVICYLALANKFIHY